MTATGDGLVATSRDGRWEAIGGVRLTGIAARRSEHPGEYRAFAQQLLRRHMDALTALSSTEERRLFDLRLISTPQPGHVDRGEVGVYVLAKVTGDSEDVARRRAASLRADLYAALAALSDHYEFAVLGTEAEVERVLRPFSMEHFADLLRREGFVPLDSLEIPKRASPVGFRGKAESGKFAARPPELAYHVYPLLPTCESFVRLFGVLLHQPAPIVISMLLEPSVLSGPERSGLLGVVEAAEAAASTAHTALRMHAELMRQTAVRQLHRLEDAAYRVSMRVGSPAPLRSALVETLGSELTAPGAYDDAEPLFSGGFEWARAEGDAVDVARRALEDMEPLAWIDSDAPPGLQHLPCLMSLEEAAGVFRMPFPVRGEFPGLYTRHARTATCPRDLAGDGVRIGAAVHRGREEIVSLATEDRRRHCYVVGQTGTGKSTLLLRKVVDDVRNGRGVCLIDPHGDLVDAVLPHVPESRWDDVILFDPDDREFPVGLNMLEWRDPDERYFLADEMMAILFQMFPREFLGPVFEHNVRNALLLLMADKDRPGTLIELPRLFQDPRHHRRYLPMVGDPLVRDFWALEFSKMTAHQRAEMVGYLVSKFARFVGTPVVRNLIGQPQSGFDFRAVMDDGKLLLCKLSKGQIGELSARLLGMVLVAKLLSAALSRADVPEAQRRDFHLYVDEFQSLVTPTFASILSEARKYRLSLTVANQYLWQVGDDVLQAVLGNVGTLIAFRIGPRDAETLEPYFAPTFDRHDLMNLDRYHAYVNTLVQGRRGGSFCMRTLGAPDDALPSATEEIMARVHARRRPRAEVESEIAQRLLRDPPEE